MLYASHVSLLILSLFFRCMISNHYDYDPNAVKAECKHDMHTHIPIITYKMYNLLFLVCPDNLYIFFRLLQLQRRFAQVKGAQVSVTPNWIYAMTPESTCTANIQGKLGK